MGWLEYLFPRFCLSCDSEGDFLCERCLKKIQLHGIFACPVCHKPTGFGVACVSCRPHSSLDALISLAVYEEKKPIGRLVHGLKYQYIEWLAGLFPVFFERFLLDHKLILSISDMVVPVPLHGRRFAERGFNQADLIALALGKVAHLPISSALSRIRYTRHQARLPKHERTDNVANAFVSTLSASGKRCILVDDVFTTGATMQECAKVLKSTGALEVIGVVLARG